MSTPGLAATGASSTTILLAVAAGLVLAGRFVLGLVKKIYK